MKIKKEWLNKVIIKGSVRIYLSEVVEDRVMDYLKLNHPNYLESIKKKKKNVASEK